MTHDLNLRTTTNFTVDTNMATPKRQRRAVCPGCLRPTPSACICSALPATRLQLRSVHCVVLQHPHEAALKNASLPLVQLCVHPDNLTVLIGRRLPTIPNSTTLEDSAISPPIQGASNTDTSASSTARRPEIGWIQDGDRDVWLLFPSPAAISLRRALQQRQHPTKKIVLLVLDGTWKVCSRACAPVCAIESEFKNWFMMKSCLTLSSFSLWRWMDTNSLLEKWTEPMYSTTAIHATWSECNSSPTIWPVVGSRTQRPVVQVQQQPRRRCRHHTPLPFGLAALTFVPRPRTSTCRRPSPWPLPWPVSRATAGTILHPTILATTTTTTPQWKRQTSTQPL
jgi:DTW domain